MSIEPLEFGLLGDGALSVKLGNTISEEINDAVLYLCDEIERLNLRNSACIFVSSGAF